MSSSSFRLLLAAWMLLGVLFLVQASMSVWASWPPEAQHYARWLAYQIENTHLPASHIALVAGPVVLLLGSVLLLKVPRIGRAFFALGLCLLLYSQYSPLPAISDGAHQVALAAFLIISGVVLGASFSRPMEPKARQAANPSIERTCPGEPGHAAHVERYAPT